MSEIFVDRFFNSEKQKKIIFDLLDFKIKNITWDFDQILIESGIPFKKKFYLATGIDCRDWPIDRWLAVSHRAAEKGLMSFNEASALETKLWNDPYGLADAMPIRAMQTYSKMAFLKGIGQSIVTAREPNLRDVTMFSVRKHFEWISDKDVYIRNDASTVCFRKYPALVSF